MSAIKEHYHDTIEAAQRVQPKERPILFSPEMVRAILEGRKTQTRRVVKSKIALEWLDILGFKPEFVAHFENDLCPYGKFGDYLWVRETIFQWQYSDGEKGEIAYLDDPQIEALKRDMKMLKKQKSASNWRIISSIHMPRAASRILLEITDIRVERLHDITEADAVAEGFLSGGDWDSAPTTQFFEIWEKIHGRKSLESDPWVWVITFKPITPEVVHRQS